MRRYICRALCYPALCGSTILAGTSTPASAQSAPPSGDAIIRQMHDRYAGKWYRTLTFTQKTTLLPKPDSMVTETWLEKAMMPGQLRIDMQKAAGALSYIFANDSTYVIKGDSVKHLPGSNHLLIIGFDVYAQPVDRTVAALAAEHFPMAPVHEDTWEGRPVYVIGARAGDTHSHQIWIDKDRLLFVRSLRPANGDTTKTGDIRFENYVEMPGGGWLSERVEFFTAGKLTQKEEYSEVKTNVPLDPKIFTVKR